MPFHRSRALPSQKSRPPQTTQSKCLPATEAKIQSPVVPAQRLLQFVQIRVAFTIPSVSSPRAGSRTRGAEAVPDLRDTFPSGPSRVRLDEYERYGLRKRFVYESYVGESVYESVFFLPGVREYCCLGKRFVCESCVCESVFFLPGVRKRYGVTVRESVSSAIVAVCESVAVVFLPCRRGSCVCESVFFLPDLRERCGLRKRFVCESWSARASSSFLACESVAELRSARALSPWFFLAGVEVVFFVGAAMRQSSVFATALGGKSREEGAVVEPRALEILVVSQHFRLGALEALSPESNPFREQVESWTPQSLSHRVSSVESRQSISSWSLGILVARVVVIAAQKQWKPWISSSSVSTSVESWSRGPPTFLDLGPRRRRAVADLGARRRRAVATWRQ
ncbi:hypothetical protein QBC39DRAFT_330722 [Podospora conica]|nr:hypothetical protein QBC39DRAFT_330722 [Schizothecium conicum]